MKHTVNDAERFARLFTGRSDIYGLGAGRVVKAPLTIAQYRDHLYGPEYADHETDVQHTGLGVFPLRQDGTVSFAAIDLDRPDFELAHNLAEMLPGPAYVERSRSGNAHVWVFFSEPIEAWITRGVMLALLEAVGERNVEVFPKQDRLRDEAAFGNYINLPYHGGNRPILYDDGDSALTLQQFLMAVEFAGTTPPETWRRRAMALGVRAPDERPETAAFGERATLHECAARIYRDRCERPLVEGHRDVVLFNFAKMVLNWREITAEEARELVDEVNACAEPPLEKSEVDRLFRNAIEKRYTSTGCDDPLMADYVDPNCPILRGA